MALGQIFREARIRKGYTESEVADRIKMNPQMVADLETENYSRIAAPIYGKGYVRKYAEFLGLDFRPLVDEFTATFETNKNPKPVSPLEVVDPISGMLTGGSALKNNAQEAPNSNQQSTSQSQNMVQSMETTDTSSNELNGEASLFSQFENPAETNVSSQDTDSTKQKEEVFVSAHLATTPPTATIPPPNSIPDSVAQSRYTFSPEKFTPRTTVFKPEQLPSATAPEPIALSVAPFSYPEPEGVAEEYAPPIFVGGEDEEDTLFSERKRTTTNNSVNKNTSKKENVAKDEKSDGIFFVILNYIIEFFKDIFDTSEESDLTKALARKQRRLGFIFAIVLIVILIAVWAFSGGESKAEVEDQVVETEESVEAIEENSIVETDKNPDKTMVSIETVEVKQILPTPKGFLNKL